MSLKTSNNLNASYLESRSKGNNTYTLIQNNLFNSNSSNNKEYIINKELLESKSKSKVKDSNKDKLS